MHFSPLRRWLAALGAALILALTTLPASAKPVKVRFNSADGVQLGGWFYASTKKNDAPCVLLIHAIGGDSKITGWDKLAVALQDKGFAVLRFDLRGHGLSKDVDAEEFWNHMANRNGVKGFNPAKLKQQITFKDFTKAYTLNLVNDIAAAKTYLDRRNDSGDCNSANLIMIAEGTGASLAALWMRQEWYRFRITNLRPVTVDKNPEGKDVTAAIFLSYDPKVGGTTLYPTKMLSFFGKDKGSGIAFLYGDKDKAAKELATRSVKILQGKNGKIKKFITGKAVGEAGTLKGVKLLATDLGTQKLILTYLENLMDKGEKSYDTREFKKTGYLWVIPGRRAMLAKKEGDKALNPIPAALFVP